jgi:hypothetical protein
VRHIAGWYAQKHPDEDFAETSRSADAALELAQEVQGLGRDGEASLRDRMAKSSATSSRSGPGREST